MNPGKSFEDEVFLTEKFLNETLVDIYTKFDRTEDNRFVKKENL